MQRETLGNRDPNTLASVNNLDHLLRAKGDFAAAVHRCGLVRRGRVLSVIVCMYFCLERVRLSVSHPCGSVVYDSLNTFTHTTAYTAPDWAH